MAEATIMLMLVSLYDLKSAENQLREMRPRPRGPMSARMVKGKTIGIIGYGNISRAIIRRLTRSEEHTSELQSLMRISYAVFCLKKQKTSNVDANSSDDT